MYKIPRPVRVALTVVVLCLLVILTGNELLRPSLRMYERKRLWYIEDEGKCVQPRTTLDQMASLVADASVALHYLGVPSAACYGTLIGALRRGDILPWDNNVDLCVVDKIPQNFETIRNVFELWDICIEEYDTWSGHYRIERDNLEGFINVFVKYWSPAAIQDLLSPLNPFVSDLVSQSVEREESWVCPAGVLPYFSNFLEDFNKPFPSHLLQPPFPSIPLGKEMINITNGDGEILKYLYPRSWWVDIKLKGCREQH